MKENNAKISGILSIVSGIDRPVEFPNICADNGNYGFHSANGWWLMATFAIGECPADYADCIRSYGPVCLLLGILGIVGGVYALKRKHWGLGLTAAIAGTLLFFPTGDTGHHFYCHGKEGVFPAGNLRQFQPYSSSLIRTITDRIVPVQEIRADWLRTEALLR